MNQSCDHEFIQFADKQAKEKTGIVMKVRAVCIYCGHSRNIYEDGTVEIIMEKGDVKKRLM
jgi:hypothetical protein